MFIQNPNYKLIYFDNKTGELKASLTGIPTENDIGISLIPLFFNPVEIDAVECDTAPTRDSYTEGDTYDFTGLKVIVVYVDGSEQVLADDEYYLTATLNGEDTSVETAPAVEESDTPVIFSIHYDDFEAEDAFTFYVTPQK
jgi:hypothetical protein